MMAMINVNSDVKDGFYRYKMPRLLAKVEGKGNGIKTVITNMKEIATALNRPAMYPTKYFGCELGAQTMFDQKNDRYIVNGAHEGDKLQTMLFTFIKKFVLCPSCDNPETDLCLSDKKGVTARCKACGHAFPMDPVHRLTQYMLKNPPNCQGAGGVVSSASGKAGVKGGKKGKKGGNEAATTNGGDAEGDENVINDNVRNGADVGQKLSGEMDHNHNTGSDDNDDGDWAEDELTEDAAARRVAELSSAVRVLALDPDLDKPLEQRVNLFVQFVQSKIALLKIASKDVAATLPRDIKLEADRLELGDEAVMIVAEIFWCNPDDMVQCIKQSVPCLQRFTDKKAKAQMCVISAAEKTVQKFQDNGLLSKAVNMFKCLYDEDVVEEATFLEWASKGPSKKSVPRALSTKIHENVKIFIRWLREAPVESSSEEEEEEEDNEMATQNGISENQMPVRNEISNAVDSKVNGDDEDDIDIDNI